MQFIRYVVSERDPDSGERLGIFQAAAQLREDGQLSEAEAVWLDEIWRFFSRSLNAPARFRRSGRAASRRAGISWMRTTAHEHVRRLHELAGLLRQHGIEVEMLGCDQPGYIVWDDEHQVLAVPFKSPR